MQVLISCMFSISDVLYREVLLFVLQITKHYMVMDKHDFRYVKLTKGLRSSQIQDSCETDMIDTMFRETIAAHSHVAFQSLQRNFPL